MPTEAKNSDKQKMRAAARLFAVQALFQMEASGNDLQTVQQEFEDHRFGAEIGGDTYAEGNITLFRTLLKTALEQQRPIDQMTDKALAAKWPLGKIDPTLRAVFRAAGAELLGKSTPAKVTINEFVDVARAFFPDGKEAGFVNAVLDHMARAVQPEAFG